MKISNVSYNCNCSLVANRYYNPCISQFYATDPLAEKYPGINPYVYTIDNPINYIDPTGMMCQDTKGKTIPCPKGHEDHNGPTATTLVFDKNGKVEAEIGYDEVYGGQLDTVVITKTKKKNCNKNIIILTDKSNEVLKKLDYYSSDNTMMGVNLSALELKSIENSEYVYKYASGNLSAIELTAINKATQLKIAKFEKYGGRPFAVLGAVTSIYQYSQDEISGYRLAGDLFFTVLPVILPGAGTLVNIVYFTETVVYDTTIKDNE